MKQVTTRPHTAANGTMDQLVLSYLVYQGYMRTAQAAIKNIEHVTSRTLRLSHAGSEPNDREEKDMYARQSESSLWNWLVLILTSDHIQVYELQSWLAMWIVLWNWFKNTFLILWKK